MVSIHQFLLMICAICSFRIISALTAQETSDLLKRSILASKRNNIKFSSSLLIDAVLYGIGPSLRDAAFELGALYLEELISVDDEIYNKFMF